MDDLLEEVPEENRQSKLTACVSTREDLLTRFSSFQKLLRVLAYLLRFIEGSSGGDRPGHLALSTRKLDKARMMSVKQNRHYGTEIE